MNSIPRFAAAAAAAAIAAAAQAGTAAAQEPPHTTLLREVLGDGHKPLDAAAVRFHPQPRPSLRCLLAAPYALPAHPPVAGRTNARGRVILRIPRSDLLDDHGALVVTWPAGDEPVLGAIQYGHAASTQVTCRPLAEIRLSAGSDVHIQALAGDAGAFDLGWRRDVTRVRLPRGAYRLLVQGPGRLAEHSIRVRAGERTALPAATGQPRTLALPDGFAASLFLRHRPQAPLPIANRHVLVPTGRTPRRLIAVAELPGEAGTLQHYTEHWVAPDATALDATAPCGPVHQLRILDAAGEPVAGATVFALHRTWTDTGMHHELHSRATSGADGRARFCAGRPDAETHVVIVAPGHATHASPAPKAPVTTVRLPPGETLVLQVQDPRGQPAAHLRVDLAGEQPSLLDATVYTDALGRLQRGDLRAGTVSVRLIGGGVLADPVLVRVARGEVTAATIRARPGFTVHGHVLRPDGERAAGAVVALRDSTGRTAVRRTVVADARGEFAIHGLPEHARLRLSATLTATGRPFISEQIWVSPGAETTWELVLKSEDPRFPGRRGK